MLKSFHNLDVFQDTADATNSRKKHPHLEEAHWYNEINQQAK